MYIYAKIKLFYRGKQKLKVYCLQIVLGCHLWIFDLILVKTFIIMAPFHKISVCRINQLVKVVMFVVDVYAEHNISSTFCFNFVIQLLPRQ